VEPGVVDRSPLPFEGSRCSISWSDFSSWSQYKSLASTHRRARQRLLPPRPYLTFISSLEREGTVENLPRLTFSPYN